MSRKDYVAIAAVINSMKYLMAEQLHDELVHRMGAALKADNSAFKFDKFEAACKGE